MLRFIHSQPKPSTVLKVLYVQLGTRSVPWRHHQGCSAARANLFANTAANHLQSELYAAEAAAVLAEGRPVLLLPCSSIAHTVAVKWATAVQLHTTDVPMIDQMKWSRNQQSLNALIPEPYNRHARSPPVFTWQVLTDAICTTADCTQM
jgi:hypothetical protein